MRIDLFEELTPVCPRCLHTAAAQSPLVIAESLETRAGHLWHGLLHCSNQACWAEFPVIDGVPVITPDPPATIRNAQHQVLARDDLPPVIESVLGDALGQGTTFDTDRQHINLYAGSHFADWAGEGDAPLIAVLNRAMALLPEGAAAGPALDLGCSVGRGCWEMAARTGRAVLGLDLNFAMLRLAQRLMVEGRARYPRRRIGLVYDPVEVELPGDMAGARVDFWAADCLALPFAGGTFGLAGAVNLVDCIAGPTEMLTEMARVLAPGAGAFLTTPFDWAQSATEMAGWMGGHSQRAPHGGAGEPVLKATLDHVGLTPVAEADDIPWTLGIHARSVMHYRLHAVGCRRAG